MKIRQPAHPLTRETRSPSPDEHCGTWEDKVLEETHPANAREGGPRNTLAHAGDGKGTRHSPDHVTNRLVPAFFELAERANDGGHLLENSFRYVYALQKLEIIKGPGSKRSLEGFKGAHVSLVLRTFNADHLLSYTRLEGCAPRRGVHFTY